MALVVLTICDDPETGSIDISAKAEPFLPGPDSDEVPTPAQMAGLVAIASIAEVIASAEEPSEAS